jgi:hypothetical protein
VNPFEFSSSIANPGATAAVIAALLSVSAAIFNVIWTQISAGQNVAQPTMQGGMQS